MKREKIDFQWVLSIHPLPISVKEAQWALLSLRLLGFLVRCHSLDHILVLNSLYTYSGVDDTLYTGSIYKFPLAPISGLGSPFWNIPLSGLRFNTNQTTYQNQTLRYPLQSNAYGKIYSSTAALIVPKALADDMNTAIGAVYNEALNLYTIACTAYDTAPSLVFEFGAGTDAEIPPQQYIYKLEDDQQSAYANQDGCYSAISGGGDGTNVFLGGPFFRSFYLTFQFSNRSVGIAQSIARIGKVYPRSSY